MTNEERTLLVKIGQMVKLLSLREGLSIFDQPITELHTAIEALQKAEVNREHDRALVRVPGGGSYQCACGHAADLLEPFCGACGRQKPTAL